MVFLKKQLPFVLLFFALGIGLCSSLFAAPSLWDAIEDYEHGEDKKAAQFFSATRVSPITRPYIKSLEEKGFLKTSAPSSEDLHTYEIDQYARGWFEVSEILRNINRLKDNIVKGENKETKTKLQKKKNSDFLKKILSLKHPAAQYVSGRFFEKTLMREKAIEAYKDSFHYGMDVRALLALKRLAPEKMEEPMFIERLPVLDHLLEKKEIGEALFDFSKFFESQEPKISRFKCILVRTAALHGYKDAQLAIAQSFSTSEEEIFYWLMQAAEQGSALAMDGVAYRLEHEKGCLRDITKSFSYSQHAVQLNQEHNPLIYYNHAIRLYQGIGTHANSEEAEIYFKRAIDHGGDDDMAHQYAECLHSNGKTSLAKRSWHDLALKGYLPALQSLLAISSDPLEYESLIPKWLTLAEKDDAALRIVAIMITSLQSEPFDNICPHLYDLLGRFEKKEDKRDQCYAYLNKALLLRYFNTRQRLKGNVIELFSKAADLESAQACFELGQCYFAGFDVKPDADKALEFFQIALQKGVLLAHEKIGLILMNRNDPRQDEKAFFHLKKAYSLLQESELRPYIAYNLALMHIENRGGAQYNRVLVEKLFSECMEHPVLRVDARYELAKLKLRETTDDVYHDLRKIREPFREDQEDKTTDTKFEEALRLLKEGVEKEDPPSLFLKGQLLSSGSKSLEQQKDGLRYIKLAIKKGAQYAKLYYAILLTLGSDAIERNIEEAKQILLKLSTGEQELYGQFIRDVLTSDAEYKSKESAKLQSEKEEESSHLDPKIQRLLDEFDRCTGKKKIKWRKMETLMQKFMQLTSGSITPGKGSGRRVECAGIITGLHIPHGRDSSELTGGRLKSMRELMKNAFQNTMDQGGGS
ncbi:MAG: hypothetical protein A2X70_02490 [Alphaproteobacteria bacterium GWC2_42_16]|nr:MAG: hypothetical protein A2X70_02490 [Alphaproteobacteria bacterium GWC2_42_16]OFW73956.1 MAG: hypothetical protein A2Z80_07755 [Alphaproteobacteria bacterium GWA2_41_27]OFW82235.1 MAG: hypothetical protein A3E50_07985 [Alphaproteobacteria bacterium RIFCSPHIGHO2_12_FULL_42_100]OFW85609.1 MAG: hypothetical protein A2W06_04160 [Alphaproteobacteria bacterium RBG_16_42_14]OFW91423.1 MAG: hypothetical protein A3C41_07410 [Alphaproteobacteria bacterium RIFCSPHIGHO2_02_FULL_42_30]OFW93174.1 MAG: 